MASYPFQDLQVVLILNQELMQRVFDAALNRPRPVLVLDGNEGSHGTQRFLMKFAAAVSLVDGPEYLGNMVTPALISVRLGRSEIR
mmetsp:Transcript_7401/g.18183  ORF Transcript_7401/g.18183 Transcript_7401/m.18183 type:complete len:86 (-) Transcript_7401:1427-1684(-)